MLPNPLAVRSALVLTDGWRLFKECLSSTEHLMTTADCCLICGISSKCCRISGSSLHFSCFLLFFIFSPTKKQNYHHNRSKTGGLYILRDRSRGSSKLLNASLKLLLVCTKLEIVIIALLIDCIY
jgi:hypothetical protein